MERGHLSQMRFPKRQALIGTQRCLLREELRLLLAPSGVGLPPILLSICGTLGDLLTRSESGLCGVQSVSLE